MHLYAVPSRLTQTDESHGGESVESRFVDASELLQVVGPLGRCVSHLIADDRYDPGIFSLHSVGPVVFVGDQNHDTLITAGVATVLSSSGRVAPTVDSDEIRTSEPPAQCQEDSDGELTVEEAARLQRILQGVTDPDGDHSLLDERGSCFSGSCLVAMADGQLKQMCDIVKGDLVMCPSDLLGGTWVGWKTATV